MEDKTISISTGTIIKTFAIVLVFWFLFLIRDIVALFFLSVILTATLDPIINWMAKLKIRRSVAVIVIYLTMLLSVIFFASFLLPPLVNQFQNFSSNLPSYSESLSRVFSGMEKYANSYGIVFNGHEFLQNIFSNLFRSGGQIFSTTVSVVTFLVSMLVILALTFYMSVKEDGMNKFLVSITPAEYKNYVILIADKIKAKIGKWFGGQLLLMLIIFLLDWITLSIFNIPYALILALLAGLLEIVPYLGPIVSAILASMIGFLISPITGLLILGILTIIQQVEGHIIVPQVMKKAVGLNPIIVILALLIGAKLGGTLGAILAVPMATSLDVFVVEFFVKKK